MGEAAHLVLFAEVDEAVDTGRPWWEVMANLIFLPLAGKLRERSKEELQLRELVKEGVLAIGTGESKRFVEEQKCSTFDVFSLS